MTKYKIEIWQYHRCVETYENNDIGEVLKWYVENWQFVYDQLGCTFYLFKNGRRLTVDEESDLGFLG